MKKLEKFKIRFELTPTESTARWTLLEIDNHLSYTLQNDLNLKIKMILILIQSKSTESGFIEIINSQKSNISIGYLIVLSFFLINCPKKTSNIFFVGDFNINLLNYNDHQPTYRFLDSLVSNSFILYILQPTRFTSHSITLIDNTFFNIISHEVNSVNITATIAAHLAQVLFVPYVVPNPSCQKSNIYERDWFKFIQKNFVFDYFDKDWYDFLQPNFS